MPSKTKRGFGFEMTQDALVSLVREIRSLERVQFLVQRTLDAGGASAWRYALTALDDRLRWCRYVASLENPHAVSMAEELVHGASTTPPASLTRAPHIFRVHGPGNFAEHAQDERAAASTSQKNWEVVSLPELPKGARVH